tara:strand:+ start:4574 stop:5053 length:480 start_codon:yes stop_codon:yes gene_type:complete
MSEYVNKYKMKYPDYNFPDNRCVSSDDFHTITVNPNILDQIEDIDFWNRAYNYTNIVTRNGQVKGLKGVCNPLLLDNCENPSNNNPGICNLIDYVNLQPLNIPYKRTSQNYQQKNTNEFSITENFKLDTNSEIINDENFARLYCKSGSLKEEDGKFLCA